MEALEQYSRGMSREVEFEDVRQRVGEFGTLATLISVTDSGTPHTVSVVVDVDTDSLLVAVGARSLANVSTRPGVSLLWPAVDDGNYQLILDGTATPTGLDRENGLAEISVHVSSGILNRVAGRRSTGPTCVALGATSFGA
jgi:hypothetical protein